MALRSDGQITHHLAFINAMSSAGESRRRAEIEAKRAKLAELKRAREERTNRLQAGRTDGKSVSEVSHGREELALIVIILILTSAVNDTIIEERLG